MLNTEITLKDDPKKVYELMGRLHKYYDAMKSVENLKAFDESVYAIRRDICVDPNSKLELLADAFNDEIIKYVTGENITEN
jgi:hypothetical protein